MKRPLILLLLAIQAAAGGCALLKGSPKPVVLRRYAAHTDTAEGSPSVAITVFALPVPATPSAETGITNLGAEAQAELVKVMSARTQNGGAQELAQALAIPIRGAGSTPSFHDMTRISRRLVFSLDNQSRGPANRISEARIFVRPANARFVSWNRMENEYQTLDLGKLSFTQERSTRAELGLTLPVLGATPSASASAGSTLQEDIVVSQRRTALTGTLRPEIAMLLQQGGTGIDLTGNVTADFELVVPSGGHETVFIPSLPSSCRQQPSFNTQTIRYAARSGAGPATVSANVQLHYVLRDVPRGHATLMEGDDSVVFRRGTSTVEDVEVIPGETLRFSVFELRMDHKTVMIVGANPGATSNRVSKLQFATFDAAAATLEWLRDCTVAALEFPLIVDGRRLGDDDARTMFVWRTPVNYAGEGGDTPVRR